VLDIIINYNIDKKEDVYIKITELKEKNLDINNFVAYETNVTDISNIFYSKIFLLPFNQDSQLPCLMKKIRQQSFINYLYHSRKWHLLFK